VVEHQDRLTRFGFGYIEQLLQMQDRSLEVMLPTETKSLAHDGSKP
jgi:putative resolvase